MNSIDGLSIQQACAIAALGGSAKTVIVIGRYNPHVRVEDVVRTFSPHLKTVPTIMREHGDLKRAIAPLECVIVDQDVDLRSTWFADLVASRMLKSACVIKLPSLVEQPSPDPCADYVAVCESLGMLYEHDLTPKPVSEVLACIADLQRRARVPEQLREAVPPGHVLLVVKQRDVCLDCDKLFDVSPDEDECPSCKSKWCLSTYYGDPEHRITESALADEGTTSALYAADAILAAVKPRAS